MVVVLGGTLPQEIDLINDYLIGERNLTSSLISSTAFAIASSSVIPPSTPGIIGCSSCQRGEFQLVIYVPSASRLLPDDDDDDNDVPSLTIAVSTDSPIRSTRDDNSPYSSPPPNLFSITAIRQKWLEEVMKPNAL
jgi:hypothetical protein